MINEHDHGDEHEHEHEHGPGCGHEHEAMELADALQLDSRTQIFLEMRTQNLELLKVATQVAGFSRDHAPLKPEELRKAMRSIWEIYSEFYQWVDPEEEGDEEIEEDDE